MYFRTEITLNEKRKETLSNWKSFKTEMSLYIPAPITFPHLIDLCIPDKSVCINPEESPGKHNVELRMLHSITN